MYLNDASGEPVTIGHSEWGADLIILTYLPFYQGEEKLDEINEKINNAILFKDFKNFSLTADFYQSYDYEYDTENNVWVGSSLTFRIQYKFQQLNKCNLGDE